MLSNQARTVFVSHATPEETLKTAQVVIVTETTWHFLGRVKGRIERGFMPEAPSVTCPIVDISHLSEDYDRAVNHIYHAHVTYGGVNQVDGMIAELVKLGAVVTNFKGAEETLASEMEEWQKDFEEWKDWDDTYKTLLADMRG